MGPYSPIAAEANEWQAELRRAQSGALVSVMHLHHHVQSSLPSAARCFRADHDLGASLCRDPERNPSPVVNDPTEAALGAIRDGWARHRFRLEAALVRRRYVTRRTCPGNARRPTAPVLPTTAIISSRRHRMNLRRL